MNPKLLSAIACTGLLAACASSPRLSAETYSKPREAIRAAEAVGAKSDPQAALHLRLANEQLARADALMRSGDGDEAQRMLLRAQADAELAQALAHNEEMKDDVDEVYGRIRALERSTR